MPAATIEINDYEILAALTQLARNVDHLEPALDAIGELVDNSIQLNFADQHDPDGNNWAELSAATLENRRGGSGQIMRDTGLLNRSITHNPTDTAVEIGTDKAYANMMQFGGKKSDYPWLWGDIPARPFVGVSDADRGQILDLIGHYLERAIR